MADYTTLQGVTPNVREMMRQDASFTAKQDISGTGGFSKALGVAQDVMSLAGPMAGAAAPYMGMKGSAITTAAISGFSGGSGGFSAPGYGGSATGYGGKALSAPGTAPGFPGAGGAVSGGLGTAPGYPGGAGMPGGADQTGQFNSQID